MWNPRSERRVGILLKGSAGLDPDSSPFLYRLPPPHCPGAVAGLAAPSPTAELETAPRDSKSEAAGQRGFLAKFVMLVVSKPELQNHFRTFPAKVEFSKPSSGRWSCFYGKPGFCTSGGAAGDGGSGGGLPPSTTSTYHPREEPLSCHLLGQSPFSL